jgi:tetratricopeptide (TPR) repeat protein
MTSTTKDYKRCGNVAYTQGRFSEGVSSYSKGLRLVRDKREALDYYCNRALCYLKLNCFEKALQDTKAVLEIDPGHEKGKDLIAIFY